MGAPLFSLKNALFTEYLQENFYMSFPSLTKADIGLQ